MGRLRFTARSSIIALSAAAALAAAAAGPAAAAPLRAAHGGAADGTARHAAGVSWHALRLLHGWKTDHSKQFEVADPSYAISNGVVYLDGALKQPAGTNDEFAVLPRAARPRHDLFISVFSGFGDGIPSTLLILPDGSMRAYGGAAQTVAMLSAVSYPVRTARWHRLKLIDGWNPASHHLAAAAPSYLVSGGIVYLSGSAAGGLENPIAVLPKGARPRHQLYLADDNFGGSGGSLAITPAGAISAYGGTAKAQTSLDALSFPAAGAKGFRWHKLALSPAWASSQPEWNSGGPAYAVVGPIVYLEGSMHFLPSVPGGSAIFGDLPRAVVPPHVVAKQVYTYGDTTGAITLVPSFGIAGSNPPSPAQDFTSLAGIAYPRNS